MTHIEIRDAIIANDWQLKPAGEIAELLNAPQTVRVERMAELGTPMKYLGAEAGRSCWIRWKPLPRRISRSNGI